MRESIEGVKRQMSAEGIDPERGLGRELFLFASTLMPVVNVDLLIVNDKREILLAWRDDPHCGKGWHIPGGCIRMRETFSERIQKTAVSEIGTHVVHSSVPVWVFEIFSPEHRDGIEDQHERAHFVTLAFACRLPERCEIKTVERASRAGDLKWFAELPGDLLKVQDCYAEHWREITENIWRDHDGNVEE